MVDEIEIFSAIEKGELFSGMDPLYYAAITRTELEGINPLLWAIENGKTGFHFKFNCNDKMIARCDFDES